MYANNKNHGNFVRNGCNGYMPRIGRSQGIPSYTRRVFNDRPRSSNGGSSAGNTNDSGANSLNSDRTNDAGNNNGKNLIVNYLPQDMSDAELFALFSTSGTINTCKIMRDYKSGYSYGYAFINFAEKANAERAIENFNGINIRNKRLKVSYARPGGASIKDTNLYITNLPNTITYDKLDDMFGKYGKIVQKNILRDKTTGIPRGVAFVRFNQRNEAQNAIAALNNFLPEDGIQPIQVRLAEEHGKAKAQYFLPHPVQLQLNGPGLPVPVNGPPLPAPQMTTVGHNFVMRGMHASTIRMHPYQNAATAFQTFF